MFDYQSVVVPEPAPASNYVLVGDRHRFDLGPQGDLPGDRPDAGGAERVGGHAADGYVYGLSGSEGGVEGGAVLGLYPDDPNCSLHGSGHSGHQPAAANGDQDHIKPLGDLLDKLQPDRSLAGAHLWLVVGVANERPCPFGIDQHGLVGGVVAVANLHHFGAQRLQLVHLERRGVGRYEDPGCGPGLSGGVGEGQARVPPRGSHHASRTDQALLGCAQHAVERAAGFEGSGVLKMLELEPDRPRPVRAIPGHAHHRSPPHQATDPVGSNLYIFSIYHLALHHPPQQLPNHTFPSISGPGKRPVGPSGTAIR